MGLGPSAATVNEFLDTMFVAPGVWVELHTGDPGTNGASDVADTDGRQLALFTRPSNGLAQTTGALPQFVIGADQTITHASVHTELDGGTWRWNLIARSPIQVVDGDVLILGDGIDFRVDGWTA